jgi:hypothetical protein
MEKLYILLEYFNDYDQHGGYFCGAFSSEKLLRESVDHIGRINFEESWYEYEECALNQKVETEEG